MPMDWRRRPKDRMFNQYNAMKKPQSENCFGALIIREDWNYF